MQKCTKRIVSYSDRLFYRLFIDFYIGKAIYMPIDFISLVYIRYNCASIQVNACLYQGASREANWSDLLLGNHIRYYDNAIYI